MKDVCIQILSGLAPILMFLCSIDTFGQDNPSVIPPSPNSREFAKYVSQEVSLYNGIPSIDIPLYTIQLRGLSIPITLSYHASGIKYAQGDGNVGVGWVLNPGFRVSRNIYGFADELVAMPTDLLTQVTNLENQATSNQGKVNRDRYLAKFVPGTEFIYGQLDGEYDQFTFSTPTGGGGFIISDRVNKVVATTEESNLQIDYNIGQSVCSGLNGIKGFQLVDERGNNFFFGEYNNQSQCVLETASAYYGGDVATAWGISNLKTTSGDEVTFKYKRVAAGEYTDHIRSFTVVEANPFEGAVCNGTTTDEHISTGQGYYTFYPEEITTPKERVFIHYSPSNYHRITKVEIKTLDGESIRTIDLSYSDGSRHTFLDQIAIHDAMQNEVETFNFEYYDKNSTEHFAADHYGYYLTTPNPQQYYHQEFLDDPVIASVNFTGQDNCIHQTMNFYMGGLATSREPDNQFAVPKYFSLKRVTYPSGGYTDYEYEHGKFQDVGSSGPARNAGIRIATIKSYDLGSQQPLVKRYTYGIDENGYGQGEGWIHNPESLFVKETVAIATGLEGSVRRIITYSSAMQGDVGTVFGQSGFVKYPCVTEYHSSSINGIGKTVYFFDIGNELDGWTLSTRNVIPNEVYSGSPYYVHRFRSWDKPLLHRKIVYSHIDAQYVPIQEEVFEYNETSWVFSGLRVEQSASNGGSNITDTSYDVAVPAAGFALIPFTLDRYFNYGEYFIEVGKNWLVSKTNIQYFNGNAISTYYNYTYSNGLLSTETVSRSAGGNIVRQISYPKDYASGTDFIDDMVSSNLLAYPVEQVEFLDYGASQKILSGRVTKYKVGGKGLKHEELFLENDGSIPLNLYKFSNRSIGILPTIGTKTIFEPDSRYKSRLRYDAYDNIGNLLRVTQSGGLTTSYVWGYNGLYPIAKVDNAIYDDTGVGVTPYLRVNQVYHENFEEHQLRVELSTAHTGKHVYQGSFNIELQDKIPGNYVLVYWSSSDGIVWTKNRQELTVSAASSGYSVGSSSTYLDDIRLYPVNAQMSTYTYDPLIGMTSQTDPSGLSTYFEYDAFGRLILTKDHEKNILKQFIYEYKD